MYPGWVAGVVTPWCSPGITLKGIRFVEFDQSVSWAAKVRNVSSVGSQSNQHYQLHRVKRREG
jgi:hypothetical protein